MSDLTKFGLRTTEGVMPLVYRRAVVWSPTAPSKPAGFVGKDRRRDYKVYTTRRKPYHFYREGNGYAVSNSILSTLAETGVSRIIFHTADGEDVYEFATRQYVQDAEQVPEHELLDEDDPQAYVPVDEARNVWYRPDNPNDLFVESFEDAMDRLDNKTGW